MSFKLNFVLLALTVFAVTMIQAELRLPPGLRLTRLIPGGCGFLPCPDYYNTIKRDNEADADSLAAFDDAGQDDRF